jgi:3-oxoadipate enol-lactonase
MSLAAAVLALAPIESQLVEPLGFLPPRSVSGAGPSLPAAAFDAVTRMFKAAGLRAPRQVLDPCRLSVFDKIAAEALAVAGTESIDLEDPATAIARAGSRDVWRRAVGTGDPDLIGRDRTVASKDGVALSVYRTGCSIGTPVLIFGAPGTPAGLIAGWLRGIGAHRPVATWETRGLFGPASDKASALDVEAQIGDACAVLDSAEWWDAHVLAICGGAALALAFAAQHPDRTRSLGLWFGDYELGELAPKTAHQRNLQALMQMVVQNRVSSEQLHGVLLQAVRKLAEPDLAPLALYPYANPCLFDIYCRMNHAIMSTDCSVHLDRVRAPSFVAYSPSDVTTHPEGSRLVAQRLGAELEEVPVSGHLHALRGHAADVERALSFIRGSEQIVPQHSKTLAGAPERGADPFETAVAVTRRVGQRGQSH